MRILYGVVGEGMGHATRSKAVIDYLINQEEHEVHVVVSGRAHEMLKSYFDGVHHIWGLSMTYKDNEFSMWRSIIENMKTAIDSGLPENIRRYFEITKEFRPECVISDFESWSYLYGLQHHLPIICIDNIQMVARCRHPEELLELHRINYDLSKGFIKGKLPRSDHYYIPTFFYPEVSKERTTLVPSVLRQDILDATTSDGESVLVYQTSTSCADLPEVLRELDREQFLVYGYKRDISEPVNDGNVTYMPFDTHSFVRNLAQCKAVIANGGFTLMSESVYLHKPLLGVPVASQFEQVLNCYYLEQQGYGYGIDRLDVATIRYFFEHLDDYCENLANYHQKGNSELFGLLSERLDSIAAGLSR